MVGGVGNEVMEEAPGWNLNKKVSCHGGQGQWGTTWGKMGDKRHWWAMRRCYVVLD